MCLNEHCGYHYHQPQPFNQSLRHISAQQTTSTCTALRKSPYLVMKIILNHPDSTVQTQQSAPTVTRP